MNLPLFIGLRYTGATHKDQLVSFFSGVSITGLVLGVGLLVAVLSIMNGFERDLREKILGLVPQAAVYQKEGVEDWRKLQQVLEESERVIAATPFVQLEGLVSFGGKAQPVVLYGMDGENEKRVSRITPEFLSEDQLASLEGKTAQLVLGKDIADKLGVQPGEQVMMIVPDAERSSAPKLEYFHILAVIETKTELDNSLAITGIDHAARLTGDASKVTGMRMKITDLFSAREIVLESLYKLGYEYYGRSWMNTHGNLYEAIRMSKRLVALLMSLIVAIATFNVVSTLIMVVVEKQGDIAILRTFGASTGDILKIFMIQGIVIGCIGTALGLLFGVGLAFAVETGVRSVENMLGVQFLKSDVYPLTYLPTQIDLSDIIRVGLTALFMSFLATIYPAWKASRAKPAEILRYE